MNCMFLEWMAPSAKSSTCTKRLEALPALSSISMRLLSMPCRPISASLASCMLEMPAPVLTSMGSLLPLSRAGTVITAVPGRGVMSMEEISLRGPQSCAKAGPHTRIVKASAAVPTRMSRPCYFYPA